MKKSIITASLIAGIILGGTTLVILKDANAEKTQANSNDSSLVATTALATPDLISTSRDETVFVLADATGASQTKFIGSTLYDGAKELPFTFKITYYLDGNEINPQDLKGKSGHVKIVYTSASTAKYLGKNIPFLTLTGLTLEKTRFNNLKLENGKVLTETTDNYLVTGYTLAGLNANLGTDFLPESFTLEADVTDFKLADNYTIFTNELFADLDTSKLSSLDSLTNSIYALSSGLDQLIAGSTELSNGLHTALSGTETLYTGAKTLAAGTKTAVAGAESLSDGLNTLVSYNDDLQTGANTIITTVLNVLNRTITLLNSLGIATDYSAATTENYLAVYQSLITKLNTYQAAVAARIDALGLTDTQMAAIIKGTFAEAINGITSVKDLVTFSIGVNTYTNGVAEAAAGAETLTTGLTKLNAGATELSTGLGTLLDGETQLYTGSVTLTDGLTTFKTSGIDRLVNFASHDLQGFIQNLKSTVSAASSYHSFASSNAQSVKFIVKTAAI